MTNVDVNKEPYDAGSRVGAWFSNFGSWISSPDREWLPIRDFATARARDQIRNNPLAATAVNRKKNTVVGTGWQLSSRPLAKALKITPEVANELGEEIETEWKLYAYGHSFQMDGHRMQDFGGLLRLAVSHLMHDGEVLALIEWAEDEPDRYKTRLTIVDPDRLSNPYGRLNDAIFRGGVEHDMRGVPQRYWLREQHPHDFFSVGSFTWNGWDRYTPWGRPQVLHCFEPNRAGQTRGISRFVASLKSFRALDRFTDATLQAAVIQALIVGWMQSSAGPEAVSEWLKADDLKGFEAGREEFYGKNPVKMGDAILPAVPFGDELKLATASKEVASFEAFIRTNIRPIAANLGVTYEEITGDLSQVNYASLRAGWLMAMRDTDVMASMVTAQIMRPFSVAWLEEAFDRRYIVEPEGAPEFLDAPDAYASALYIGPGQGVLDPVKEILGDAAAEEAQQTTLENICAKRGLDYREVLQQLAREAVLKKSLGLQTTDEAIAQAIQDTKNPAKQAPEPSDDAGDPAPGAPKPGATAGRRPFLTRLFGQSGPAHDASLDERAKAA